MMAFLGQGSGKDVKSRDGRVGNHVRQYFQGVVFDDSEVRQAPPLDFTEKPADPGSVDFRCPGNCGRGFLAAIMAVALPMPKPTSIVTGAVFSKISVKFNIRSWNGRHQRAE